MSDATVELITQNRGLLVTDKPSDDLRTRIIAALLSEDDVALMADAVIRELRLRRVTDVNRSVPQSRYVTEWETE